VTLANPDHDAGDELTRESRGNVDLSAQFVSDMIAAITERFGGNEARAADAANLPRQSINRITNGHQHGLRADSYARLCRVLGLDPDAYEPRPIETPWEVPASLSQRVSEPERRVIERVLEVLYPRA